MSELPEDLKTLSLDELLSWWQTARRDFSERHQELQVIEQERQEARRIRNIASERESRLWEELCRRREDE